jgi:Concanavalin A-like lectin/glucanases superfamily
VVDGTWHHVVGTLGGGQLKIYVDGVLKAQAPVTDQINYSFASNVTVGANGIPDPDFNFMGDIDEVQMHWVERNAEWVRATYESQRVNSHFVKVAP